MAGIAEQLRQAVLQAAIQGKLTEQLPEDGDARDLLVKIKQCDSSINGQRVKAKEILEIGIDDEPFNMVICGFYSDNFMGYTAKAYYQNKTDDRIDIILDKGSINGFECTPEGAALLEPHSNAYVDIRWQEYAETYAENGNDPTSITEIVMPVFVRKDTGNNTVYIDATYSIDPQARTATPIVNPQ